MNAKPLPCAEPPEPTPTKGEVTPALARGTLERLVFAIVTVGLVLLVSQMARLAILLQISGSRDPESARRALVSVPGLIVSALLVEGLVFGVGFVRWRFGGLRASPSRPSPHTSERARFGGGWRVQSSVREALLAALLILGLGPAANLLALGVAHRYGLDQGSVLALGDLVRSARPLMFVTLLAVFATVPAIVEEFVFRGVVQSALFGMRPLVSVTLPALGFGLFHGDPLQMIATFVLGLGFGWVRHRTGSIGPSSIAHGVYNASVLLSLRFSEAAPSSQMSTALVVEVMGGLLLVAGAAWLLTRITWEDERGSS